MTPTFSIVFWQRLRTVFLVALGFNGIAQEIRPGTPTPIVLDSLYREDQFYFGISYNSIKGDPTGIANDKFASDFSNDKFSLGFNAGILRDMPLNKRRNLAIAPGIGFTYNNYNQNIAIINLDDSVYYSLLSNSNDYTKNKFALWFVDVPLELRWRGSTIDNHNFWRLHLGFKMSYLLHNRSIYKAGSESIILKNNPDFSKLHYGIYLAGGYGGVNVYANLGLNPIFKSAQINGNNINIKTFNIGLIFYIL